MNKKIIAVLLACTMCFSVLFTGCAEENENANSNVVTGNNERVSTDVAENENSSIGDKIEYIISDVAGRQQPSSKQITELAEKNELTVGDIKNYRDFLLYVNQDNETLRAIRDELAPGRAKEIPLDILFNIGDHITEHFTKYYNLLSGRNDGNVNYDIWAESVYYADLFTFDNNLDLSVNYVKPNAAESAYDLFMKTYYAGSCYRGTEAQYTFVDYNDNIMKYNTLFSIKEDVIKSDYTIVPLCDEFLLRYNSDGELETVYIFVNNVFVKVCFYNHGVIPFADKADQIDSEILTILFNKETVATASKVLTTVLETAEKLN